MSALQLLPKLARRHPSFVRVKQGFWQGVETSLATGFFFETSRHDANYFTIQAVLLPLATAGGVLVLNYSADIWPVSTKGHWIFSPEREADLLDEIDGRWDETLAFLRNGASPETFCAWLRTQKQHESELQDLGYYSIYSQDFETAVSSMRRCRNSLLEGDPRPWMVSRAAEIDSVLSALKRDPAEAMRMLDARCHSSRVALNMTPQAA